MYVKILSVNVFCFEPILMPSTRKKLLVLLLGMLSPLTLHAAPISLLDFTIIGDVSVAADGSEATLTLDTSSFGHAQMDYSGIPNLIVASAGASLEFDYDYQHPLQAGLTIFQARLFDADVGISGGTLDILTVSRFDSIQSGSISWDLTSYTGLTLGLRLLLQSEDPGIQFTGTTTTISNLAIANNLPSPVPIPAAVWLFGTALIGLVGFSKRRKVA